MSKEIMIISILWAGVFLFGCTNMRERAFEVISKPDNFIEEKIEDIIEDYTGLDIDLTSEDGN